MVPQGFGGDGNGTGAAASSVWCACRLVPQAPPLLPWGPPPLTRGQLPIAGATAMVPLSNRCLYFASQGTSHVCGRGRRQHLERPRPRAERLCRQRRRRVSLRAEWRRVHDRRRLDAERVHLSGAQTTPMLLTGSTSVVTGVSILTLPAHACCTALLTLPPPAVLLLFGTVARVTNPRFVTHLQLVVDATIHCPRSSPESRLLWLHLLCYIATRVVFMQYFPLQHAIRESFTL
jgi:hypothetical protein